MPKCDYSQPFIQWCYSFIYHLPVGLWLHRAQDYLSSHNFLIYINQSDFNCFIDQFVNLQEWLVLKTLWTNRTIKCYTTANNCINRRFTFLMHETVNAFSKLTYLVIIFMWKFKSSPHRLSWYRQSIFFITENPQAYSLTSGLN